MTEQSWVYLGQLVRALQLENVDGRRIGDHVAEVAEHLDESHTDPVDEFGPPSQLARQLAERPGSRRPDWVPPLWAAHLASFLMLLVALPLLTPWEWSDRDIPILASGVSYAVVFYGGTFWIGYAAHRRMDGRSWGSLLGLPTLAAVVVLAAVVTGVFQAASPTVLFSVPKIPYLAFAAVTLLLLVGIVGRRSNPVRFPPHARHLEPLRRGPLAGRPRHP